MIITVIVPVHNSEKYLVECMESLKRQTCKDFEVICIDDYSTDSTISIIEKYAKVDNRIKLIEDENGSYGHKINIGIEEAKSKYVSILESDDMYADDMIESMIAIINIFSPDYVDGDFLNFEDVGSVRHFNRRFKYDYPEMYNYLVVGNENLRALNFHACAIWTGVYNRDFLNKNSIRLNESNGAAYQDISFRFLVSCLARKAYHIGKVLYNYRIDNSESSTNDKSKIAAVIHEYEYLKVQLETKHINTEDIQRNFFIWKYVSYMWNIKRLNVEGARIFWSMILEEVQKDKDIVLEIRKTGQDEFLEILELERDFEEYIGIIETEKKNTNNILIRQKYLAKKFQHENMIIVGCNELSRSTYLELREEKKFVKFFCNIIKSDYESAFFEGVKVEKLEYIMKNVPNAYYVICDDTDNEMQIEEDMLARGIHKQRVVRCSN